MPTEGGDQVLAAAKKVQEMGADVVLAKLGTKGSMLIQKDEVLQQGIIKADKVTAAAVHLTPTKAHSPTCIFKTFAFSTQSPTPKNHSIPFTQAIHLANPFTHTIRPTGGAPCRWCADVTN